MLKHRLPSFTSIGFAQQMRYESLHHLTAKKIKLEACVERMNRSLKSSIFECLPSDEQANIERRTMLTQLFLDSAVMQIEKLREDISIHDRATLELEQWIESQITSI